VQFFFPRQFWVQLNPLCPTGGPPLARPLNRGWWVDVERSGSWSHGAGHTDVEARMDAA